MTAVVILAGGQGRRMGGNKPLHPYGTSTLIEALIQRLRLQSDALYIASGPADHPLRAALQALGLPVLDDDQDHRALGPLCGVLTALRLARRRGDAYVMTAPCDMPALPLDYVARLNAAPPAEAVYFASEPRTYPLCARWHTDIEPWLVRALEASRPNGGLAVMKALETLETYRLPVLNAEAFRNINRQEDL